MEQIRQAFNTFAQDYDAQREYVIPEMRQYYAAAVWAMETKTLRPSILDVGAGTGLLSAFVLDKFPDARLTLMDISENMLDEARKRFATRPDTEYIVCDYSRSELGGLYDLVCSALSIHHLVPEDKRRLFGRIFCALKPGGIFVNADQPFLTAGVLDTLLARYAQTLAPVVAPVYAGETGSPVLFARALFDDLRMLTGEAGGKGILRAKRDEAELVEIADARPGVDVDTPEQYQEAKKQVNR